MLSARRVVDMLNHLLEADPEGVQRLFDSRVPIAASLLDDSSPLLKDLVLGVGDGETTLGPLGLVNAIVGERIAAQYDKGGKLVGFQLYDVRQQRAAPVRIEMTTTGPPTGPPDEGDARAAGMRRAILEEVEANKKEGGGR